MITALTINEQIPQGYFRKIGAALLPNPPVSSIKTMGDTAVLHVEYSRKREKIAWEKIEKELGSGKKELLYSGQIPLPKQFKKYRSLAFMNRMAENGALQALAQMNLPPYKIKIGLFDPDGNSSSLLKDLLPYSSCINAVSGNTELYTDKAEEIMDESGAYISVHKSIGCLSTCHIIIAPGKIRMQLPLAGSAVTFTGEKPAVNLNGVIFDSYKVSLPREYEGIRPYSVSPEYFACALYDKGRQFELGTLVPENYVTAGKQMSTGEVCRFIRTQAALPV